MLTKQAKTLLGMVWLGGLGLPRPKSGGHSRLSVSPG